MPLHVPDLRLRPHPQDQLTLGIDIGEDLSKYLWDLKYIVDNRTQSHNLRIKEDDSDA